MDESPWLIVDDGSEELTAASDEDSTFQIQPGSLRI